MNIGPNTVVSFDYTLRDEEGEILDSSKDGTPLTYMHGQGQLIPGVEKALLGKTVGDELRFIVAPEEGYGEYDPDAVQTVSRSAFPPDAVLEEGQEFFVEDQEGNTRAVSVLAIEGDEVSLDFNHPLAGEDLDFEVKITEVRAATDEEIAHGHAHGPEGHHHHE
jgi:FKBP-type peptidyl-prolyl cis-trans isomerase SlyD